MLKPIESVIRYLAGMNRQAVSILPFDKVWGLLVFAVVFSMCAPVAQASRRPTSAESQGIRRTVMATCQKVEFNRPCRFDSSWTRVSTSDSRFARGGATGAAYSPGGVLRRRANGRWRWVIQQSGGPQECADYRRLVPRSVLRDLRIQGYDGYC